MSRRDAARILEDALDDPGDLFDAARALRSAAHGRRVTFSKKVFINLVNLCRDSCTYCTYKSPPDSAVMMNRREVASLLHLARRYGCTEALFVTGERPEEIYDQARSWLERNGFASTAEYLAYCSRLALSKGVFPHTNAGNLRRDEMRELAKTNPSMGLMLETASPRLSEPGMPHHAAPSKDPDLRLGVLRDAGSLRIPITTGLLVGIGETPSEILDSLLAIRNTHDEFGNVQEIILQNFRPKPDTAMGSTPPADERYFKIVVALARVLMPEMNLQIPPNLSPGSYADFLKVGINDWGGISPLTPDYVNPEFAWPLINDVEDVTRRSGFELKCRFPVYPEYIETLNAELQAEILARADDDGLVREDLWR